MFYSHDTPARDYRDIHRLNDPSRLPALLRSTSTDDHHPLRLQPIPWGKPDAKLGHVVCEHMVSANPPTVIMWSTHQNRVRKLMRHYRLHDARIDDIDRLVLYQTKVDRLGAEP